MTPTMTRVSDIAPRDFLSNARMWLALANGGEWSDATTPRTDTPAQFSKGQHYVYRGGSVVRLARMGMVSRIVTVTV